MAGRGLRNRRDVDVRLQPDRSRPQVAGYYLVTFKTWWTAAASGHYAEGDAQWATNLHTDKRTAVG